MRRFNFALLSAVLAALGSLCIGVGAQAQANYRTLGPPGNGPHPAVLLVSGCSGFIKAGSVNSYDERAEELRKAGYLVVFVDYIGRAGIKDCSAGMTHDRAAADVLSAAAWLRTQPNVDSRRIGAIGWSYGGGAVLAALAMMPANAPGFGKAVLYYPDCRPLKPVAVQVPTLMLLAAEDTVAKPALCAGAAGAFPAGMVKAVTLPNAYHAFDMRGLPAKTTYAFGTVGYNQDADRLAWTEARAFLP